jgi:hypothetical protein
MATELEPTYSNSVHVVCWSLNKLDGVYEGTKIIQPAMFVACRTFSDSVVHKYLPNCNIDPTQTHTQIRQRNKCTQINTWLARLPRAMAFRSSILLAMVALATLFAVGSCTTPLTFQVGKGSKPGHLVLTPNVATISDVEIKEHGGDDFSFTLNEGPTGTWTLDTKTPLKYPLCIRFAVKSGGYRIADDVIPANFKAGTTYKTTLSI